MESDILESFAKQFQLKKNRISHYILSINQFTCNPAADIYQLPPYLFSFSFIYKSIKALVFNQFLITVQSIHISIIEIICQGTIDHYIASSSINIIVNSFKIWQQNSKCSKSRLNIPPVFIRVHRASQIRDLPCLCQVSDKNCFLQNGNSSGTSLSPAWSYSFIVGSGQWLLKLSWHWLHEVRWL